MFVLIREFLAKIRLVNSNLNDKQRIASVVLTGIVIGVGIAVDKFIPFNYWANILRAGLALILGVMFFSYGYLLAVRYSDKKREEKIDYKSIREKFSYIERRNISIVLLGFWFLMLLIVSKPGILFTTMSAVMVALLVSILSFWRSLREENITAGMGFQDKRDLDFDREVQEKLKEREEKLREQELKNDK